MNVFQRLTKKRLRQVTFTHCDMYTLGNVELLQVATFTYTEIGKKRKQRIFTLVCDAYLWTNMSASSHVSVRHSIMQ